MTYGRKASRQYPNQRFRARDRMREDVRTDSTHCLDAGKQGCKGPRGDRERSLAAGP